ncbi:ectonucleoside triphosphate diphosphohydrolase 1 isoform X1 [Rhinichthys klamathensis goyatoka]|uniref:ectonucleoside triphosphate diphosphohydrolase 1 isoform X1 n=2 Tax=Rhinichthys klamathensis goyatoka TaxID=3034132 RepID=UPI0024B53F31|nr:ectonucleoside triphosphate diphosphohydrolase 1 isoform X1 [Rhinichthys klamathensis goyatoka]
MDEQGEVKVKNPWHRPAFIFLTAFIILGIVIMVSISVVQNKPLPKKYKYGIVLDAGSSHTSVYIYEWPAEKENNTGMVRQKHTCNVKGKGISSYYDNPDGAGKSLQDCMVEAQQRIPAHRHEETPVYLGATAGMRLLKMEDETASEKVLASVEHSLKTYPFSYQGARIISGQEEGAFGWITVNYLSENLNKPTGTLGALDLGGASTQITFIPQQDIESDDNSIDFRLYGNDYHLYTHSFLCYGKDQALKLSMGKKLVSTYAASKTHPIELRDPCFNPGYNSTKTVQSVFNTPCMKAVNISNGNISHVGLGDWSQCQESIRKVFNTSRCAYSKCSFNEVFQPSVDGKFGAFSAFFFVMDFLNLTSDSLAATKQKLATYCSTPWKKIVENYPQIKQKYLSEYCFSGTYILTLLEDGYNFTSENWKDIRFIKKIRDSDAGWTLGYMLNLTNMIPAEAPDTRLMPYGGYVTFMLLFTLFILVLLLLAYMYFRQSTRKAQKGII